MPSSYITTTGDGVKTPHLSVNINLPDTTNATATVSGSYQAPGASIARFYGSVTVPATPSGSNVTYWNVQCDFGNSNALSVVTSGVANPAPQNGASIILYSAIFTSATTNPATNAAHTQPGYLS